MFSEIRRGKTTTGEFHSCGIQGTGTHSLAGKKRTKLSLKPCENYSGYSRGGQRTLTPV